MGSLGWRGCAVRDTHLYQHAVRYSLELCIRSTRGASESFCLSLSWHHLDRSITLSVAGSTQLPPSRPFFSHPAHPLITAFIASLRSPPHSSFMVHGHSPFLPTPWAGIARYPLFAKIALRKHICPRASSHTRLPNTTQYKSRV